MEIFKEMKKKGWHDARLIDVSGKPKNKGNVATTDFEKKAVAAMKEAAPSSRRSARPTASQSSVPRRWCRR